MNPVNANTPSTIMKPNPTMQYRISTVLVALMSLLIGGNVWATSTLVSTTTTTTTYDNYGNPTTITVGVTGNNPDSVSETYTTTTTNTYTNDTTNWYLGRLTQATVTQTLPDATSETRTSSFSYDTATGLLIQEVIEPNTPALTLTTDYVYDVFGNKTSVTVSGGSGATAITSRTTTSTYDARGQFATSTTNALGHSESRTYDAAFGVMLSLTGPNTLTTNWTYDSFGRQVSESRADLTSTTITREWCDGFQGESGNTNCPTNGVLALTTQSDGAPKSVAYSDALGREIRVETEGFAASGGTSTPIYVDTEYNALGQVIKKSRPYFNGDPIYWTHIAYDVVGRVTSETSPDTSVMTISYDGLATSTTNSLNQVNTRINNVLGELARVIDADLNESDYSYDAFGNLIQLEDTLGNTTTNTYDLRGRKITMDDPDMGQWSYSYNALGELVSQTDAKSQIVTMTYDLLGRMVSRVELEGTTTWTYDHKPTETPQVGITNRSIGKLIKVESAEGKDEAYEFDSLGRLAKTTTTIDLINYISKQTYDLDGRVYKITYPASPDYPNGLEVQNNYTIEGYLESVENTDINNNVIYWQAEAINAEGQFTQQKLANGVTTKRVYDTTTGRISSIGSSTSGGINNVQNLHFGFDTLGNATYRQEYEAGIGGALLREETFEYDNLNRMDVSTLEIQDDLTTSADEYLLETKTYNYDALGNITYKQDIGNYYYNSTRPHAVTSAGGKTIDYDANGNITSNWNFTAGGTRDLYWTSYNKPNQIQQFDADDNVVTTLTFSYGAGRELFKQQVSSDNSTRLYVTPLYEKDINGAMETHIHYIKGGDGTVALYKSKNAGTEETRYLHKDHLGSITAITDETGAIKEQLSYDPWGKRRQASWEDALTQVFGQETKRCFTGHIYLDDVGIINMGGRIYDPDLGRFMSPDPFIQEPSNAQNFNRYSYVLNNPLSYTDPSGFFFKSLFKAVFKAVKKIVKSVINTVKTALNPQNIIRNLVTAGAFLACGPGCAAAADAGFTAANGGSLGEILFSASSTYFAYSEGQIIEGVDNSDISRGLQYIGNSFKETKDQVQAATVATVVNPILGAAKFINGAASDAFDYVQGVGQQLANDQEFQQSVLNGVDIAITAISITALVVDVATLPSGEGVLIGIAARSAGTTLKRNLKKFFESVGKRSLATKGLGKIDPNKVSHVFGQSKHNLDGVVKTFGSPEKAFVALQKATQTVVKNQGINGVFETAVKVGGETVTVRGNVIDGVVKIGTAFK